MKQFRLISTAALLALVATHLLVPSAFGQSQSDKAKAERLAITPEGKPDFSGFWQAPVAVGSRGGIQIFDKAKMSPLKPGGATLLYEPHNGNVRHDEPRAFCAPSGFPWGMLAPYPLQIIQTAKYITIVHEFQRMTRIIPMDRPHRRNVEPSYQGDSVAHWDGDTLVIDTNNFKPWIVDDYHYFDKNNTRMHTDAFHTIERLRRTDAKTASYQITVDDPKIFSAPWSQDFVMAFHPEWENDGLFEFVCEENNRCPGGVCNSETK